jgi:hypothetical protein
MKMGWVYAEEIKKAANYLLCDILPDCIQVRYSRFYDGTEKTSKELVADMGYPELGSKYVPSCPELFIDLAAGELERQGFVKLTYLKERLADGEPDYLIELTLEGIEKMIEGIEPVFRSLNL